MRPGWHLAQMNVAATLDPLDDPRLAGFVAELGRINALADASPGFLWRLQTDEGDATALRPTGDPSLIVNMSVWETVEALFGYVYRTDHREVMVRRRQWFRPPEGPYQALWWVEAGRLPSVEEGLDRLRELARRGPTARAFTFKRTFPPPGPSPAETRDLEPEPCCVGWR